MSNDDSLQPVTNVQNSGGRATTPQLKRHNTPQRSGSAPRASSAPKGVRLEKLSFEVQSCNKPLRSTSRRKLRKWENDNLLGLRAILKFAVNRTLDLDDDDDSLSEGNFQVNWQSMFSEITASGNEDALHAYLKCSHSFSNDTSTRSRTLQDCVNEWDRAEFSWTMVEKRLRSVVLRAISNPETQAFISIIEEILLESVSYDIGSQVTMDYKLPDEMKHLFAAPMKLLLSKSPSPNAKPTLVIALVDSPFHRLLLHTICQFHGCHSKSFHDKKTGARSTRITPFHSKKCQHSISLVPFLLYKTSLGTNIPGDSGHGHNDSANSDAVLNLLLTSPADEAALVLEKEEKYFLVGDAENI